MVRQFAIQRCHISGLKPGILAEWPRRRPDPDAPGRRDRLGRPRCDTAPSSDARACRPVHRGSRRRCGNDAPIPVPSLAHQAEPRRRRRRGPRGGRPADADRRPLRRPRRRTRALPALHHRRLSAGPRRGDAAGRCRSGVPAPVPRAPGEAAARTHPCLPRARRNQRTTRSGHRHRPGGDVPNRLLVLARDRRSEATT